MLRRIKLVIFQIFGRGLKKKGGKSILIETLSKFDILTFNKCINLYLYLN